MCQCDDVYVLPEMSCILQFSWSCKFQRIPGVSGSDSRQRFASFPLVLIEIQSSAEIEDQPTRAMKFGSLAEPEV